MEYPREKRKTSRLFGKSSWEVDVLELDGAKVLSPSLFVNGTG
jgi:hypothetical protein